MGFIYNDVSSQEMGVKARLESWQVSGALRNYTSIIPGKDGAADFGAVLDSREIIVSCSIFPKQRFQALVEVLDEIAYWLSPLDGLKQLIFDEIPDRYFMARLRDQVDCERVIRAAGRFQLWFLCPDPFSYAVKDEVFTFIETGTHSLTRELGNIESFPLFALRGQMTKSEENHISITIGDVTMKIKNGELAAGEILYLDSQNMTAYVTTEEGVLLRNGLSLLENIEFPTLRVGTNEITIDATNAVFTEFKVQARSRWR